MITSRDDLPARLVRVAALQLGDRDLAARWGEEWLASLPPRDGYLRWRYALSLLARGAYATRWAIRRPDTGSNWSSVPAVTRRALCPLLITSAVAMAATTWPSGSATWVLGPDGFNSNIGDPLGSFWWTQYPTARWCSVSAWCLMICVLVVLSLYHRVARWMLGAGIALSLTQTWAGIVFPQGSGPYFYHSSFAGAPVGMPGVWYPGQEAICLGAVLGGLALLFAYRTPLYIRASAGLAICALVSGTDMGNGRPGLDTTSLLGMPWSSLWLHLCQVGAGQSFGIDLGATGIVFDPQAILQSLTWGMEGLILPCIAAVAVRLGSAAICILQASAQRRSAGGSAA